MEIGPLEKLQLDKKNSGKTPTFRQHLFQDDSDFFSNQNYLYHKNQDKIRAKQGSIFMKSMDTHRGMYEYKVNQTIKSLGRQNIFYLPPRFRRRALISIQNFAIALINICFYIFITATPCSGIYSNNLLLPNVSLAFNVPSSCQLSTPSFLVMCPVILNFHHRILIIVCCLYS